MHAAPLSVAHGHHCLLLHLHCPCGKYIFRMGANITLNIVSCLQVCLSLYKLFCSFIFYLLYICLSLCKHSLAVSCLSFCLIYMSVSLHSFPGFSFFSYCIHVCLFECLLWPTVPKIYVIKKLSYYTAILQLVTYTIQPFNLIQTTHQLPFNQEVMPKIPLSESDHQTNQMNLFSQQTCRDTLQIFS